MSPSTRSSYQSRKRTKTFTGCWTCRRRKIKCDEGKPHCRQCRDKRVTCEGYGARLQWLTPDTCGKANLRSEIPCEAAVSQSLRRHIPAAPPRSVLAWSQVEGILRFIDSLESDLGSSSGESVCASVQNFGVFSAKQSPTPEPPGPVPDLTDLQPGPVARQDDDGDLDMGGEAISTYFFDNFASPSYSETAAAWDLCNLYEHQSPLALPSSTTHDVSTVGSGEIVLSHGTLSPKDEKHHEDSDEAWRLDYNELLHCLEPYVVPGQERFLMDHYRNRVVNIFCVIDNAKSPWKTIHLPRVLQCVGELSFGGSTTKIRNALRNALLSISAFFLSNDHKTASREEEAKRWGTIASRHRCDAIGLLKQAVETDLYGEERPKYKEFLATMLSMITINVMSGDTDTCSVHLDGAEQLITHMSIRKLKFSRKAQALHRIYLYLRVIYESTAPRTQAGTGSRFSPSLGSHRAMGPQPASLPQHLFLESQESPSSMMPMETNPLQVQDPAAEMVAYECIYGIPQSLLLLLKDAIEVIDMVDHERAKTGSMDISEPLASLCDKLENEIMDWPLEERLEWCQEANSGISATIIHHQTRAFHNALIIYFSQNVRMLGYRYLRQYVQTILDSIEAIEKIKAETKILAAPLFWPSFIGASEAFEASHQERFKKWYNDVSVYGIEAVRTGIQVLHELWKQGPATNRRLSSWRSIVKKTGDSLMLT
ncbi:Component of the argr regulatory complex [Fusarium albosuccineum]|uniref:Component of the argr regulatory complex n=1 Tax=Fusarium albosuccineum TaxID=1237068 RepID=A0A8H4LQC7_9HYPO|nr:Component of the argr regulatory complex [Fusarium albosuccineum]